MHLWSTDWATVTLCCTEWLMCWCVAYSRHPATTLCATARSVLFYLSWSSSVWPAKHRRAWQMTASSTLMSVRADSIHPIHWRTVMFYDAHAPLTLIDALLLLDRWFRTLPAELRQCHSLEQFKWRLKTHFFPSMGPQRFVTAYENSAA